MLLTKSCLNTDGTKEVRSRTERTLHGKRSILVRPFLTALVLFVMGITQGVAQTDNSTSAPDKTNRGKETASPAPPSADRERDKPTKPDVEDDDELVQELFFAEAVSVQKAKELQITLGTDYFKRNRSHLWQSSLNVEYGIVDGLQIGAAFPLVHKKEYEDAGGIEIAFAYALSRNLKVMALTAGLAMASAQQDNEIETKSKRISLEPFIAMARRVGKGELHADFSRTFTEESEFNFNLAGVYPWRDWRCVVEFNSATGREKEIRLTPGIIRQIAGYEFGIGFPVGLTKDTPKIGVVFKATYEFGF